MVQSPPRITPTQALDALRREGIAEAVLTPLAEAVRQLEQDLELITLEDANRRFGIPYGTLLRWLHVGHLTERGRQKFAARGGGKVLVDARQVAYLKENPPKRTGRPKKSE